MELMRTLYILSFLVLYQEVNGHLKRLPCDWYQDGTASQLHDEYSVTKVEFRCATGDLEWTNPYGAVKVDFFPPVERVESNFTVCFISETPGVTITTENSTGLFIIKTDDWFNPNEPVCVDSLSSRASVLFEVAEKGREKMRIDYFLEMKQDSPNKKSKSDCRHCTYADLREKLCSSAFAVEGKVEEHYLHSEETHIQLDLQVTRRLVEIRGADLFRRSRKHSFYEGTVAIKHKCNIRKFESYFFMGHISPEMGLEAFCFMKYRLWKRYKDRVQCPWSRKYVRRK